MDDGDFVGRVGRHSLYEKITNLGNLLFSWQEFKSGKMSKADVQVFALDVEDELFQLYQELKTKTYTHGIYVSFYITDPKLRLIHKALVRDSVLHHAIMRQIEPIFEPIFIFDSYSSRKEKGTHKAITRFHQFAWKLSKNNTKTVWVLKCDIQKFFHSVDQRILLNLLKTKIKDQKVIKLLEKIIFSFNLNNYKIGSLFTDLSNKGMPLGNLTSQLFSNVYLNVLDQFVKRDLKEKYYLRYADDFLILSRDKQHLLEIIPVLGKFLEQKLKLKLHPRKIILRRFNQGIDFLGYIIYPHYSILRPKTTRRMLKKIKIKKDLLAKDLISKEKFYQTVQSYWGLLKHCRSRELKNKLRSILKKK
ncbi:MAG: reverse transcriptase/maturase family protein [Patescibacteria group bacterium]|nr:reverse transcriptase/maturase family protein [Patescibacteria group bacterium]